MRKKYPKRINIKSKIYNALYFGAEHGDGIAEKFDIMVDGVVQIIQNNYRRRRK